MHRDFKELLSAFNEGHVKYLVVGGYAVSMHAEPRATKDSRVRTCLPQRWRQEERKI
jgi:hypothetical protein